MGGFYQFQKKNINEQYAIPGLNGAVDAFGTSAGGVTAGQTVSELLRGDAFYLTEVDRTYHDYALFSEGTYEIVHDLKLTGGIRLFRAKNASTGFDGTALAAAQEIGSGCATPFTAPRIQACNNVAYYNQTDANGNVVLGANGAPVVLPVPRYNQTGETHKVSLAYQVEPDKTIPLRKSPSITNRCRLRTWTPSRTRCWVTRRRSRASIFRPVSAAINGASRFSSRICSTNAANCRATHSVRSKFVRRPPARCRSNRASSA